MTRAAARAVHAVMTATYWEIGLRIGDSYHRIDLLLYHRRLPVPELPGVQSG